MDVEKRIVSGLGRKTVKLDWNRSECWTENGSYRKFHRKRESDVKLSFLVLAPMK